MAENRFVAFDHPLRVPGDSPSREPDKFGMSWRHIASMMAFEAGKANPDLRDCWVDGITLDDDGIWLHFARKTPE